MEINRVYNEDCLDTMKRMTNGFIDFTITSPPYDNLRDYNGYDFDWKKTIQELFRVTKPGGVVVWVVGDATINGSETGTSFKQTLYAIKCGFNLHDTMIWNKDSFTATGSLKVRYAPVFEFMFVWSKGIPSTFNPIKDRINKHCGTLLRGTIRKKDGTMKYKSGKGKKCIAKYGQRHNIWNLPPEHSNKNKCHPAQFPEQLAHDHIVSWSNKGDLVYDPFMGSGTVAKMAILSNRRYVGSEISKEYCDVIEERIKKAKREVILTGGKWVCQTRK